MTTRRKPAPKARPRREKGTGSITTYETKAGTRWRYEIEVPLDAGQPQSGTRSHSRAGFASYQEANDELLVLRAELIRNVPQVIGRDTFGGYGQRWLDREGAGFRSSLRTAGRDGQIAERRTRSGVTPTENDR